MPLRPTRRSFVRRHPRTIPRRVTAVIAMALGGFGGLRGGTPAIAQPVASAVYVDDSARAHDLLRRAIEQAADNPGETVRQFQRLLEDFGPRLVPIRDGDPDSFTSVRRRVLEALRADPVLLERHRLLETPEAERLLAAGDLERLLATRPLTRPGLEGALRSGQFALEAARFDEAIGHLEGALEHPDADLPTRVAAWSMLATAAHFAVGRPDLTPEAAAWYRQRGREALAALTEAGRPGTAPREAVASLMAAGDGPDLTSADGPLDRTASIAFRDGGGEIIWAADPQLGLPLTELPAAGRWAGRDPREIRTTAAIAEDTVYFADGLRIFAIDRFTAQPRWDRPYVESGSEESLRDDVIGMRPLTVAGDAVLAVVGGASTAQASTGNSASVIRLDAATGERRWRRPLRRLGGLEELEGLFPHGRPWVADGRVIVPARRLTPERLLSAYVVALDLETGEPLWVRHLASVGVRIGTRPVGSVLVDRGSVFVSTAVGVTARLDAATGEIDWLIRTSAAPAPAGRPPAAFELDAPVLLRDRLVTIGPGRTAIEMRSRDDGRLEAAIPIGPDTPWGTPAYLLADGSRVLLVGDDVRCLDPAVPEAPLWRGPSMTAGDGRAMSRAPEDAPARGAAITPEDRLTRAIAGGPGGDPAADDAPPTILGRVVLAGAELLIPTDRGLLMLDAETGLEQDRLQLGPGGTPTAAGAQLVLAGPGRAVSWMALEEAESLLRDRIAKLPREPGPRLSLLRLAVRLGRLPLVLETAGMARDAILGMSDPESEPPRRELFEILIAADAERLLQTPADAEVFFDLLERVAGRDDERVAARLGRGDWLAARDPLSAVLAWRRILEDPRLATTPREEQDGLRSSRDWALERITAVLASPEPTDAGGSLREAVESLAREAAAAAIIAAGGDPAAPEAAADLPLPELDRLAAAWPFTDTGLRCGRLAATRLESAGQFREAAALRLQLHRDMPTEARAAGILGHQLDALLAADRPEDARRLAEAIDARHPGVALERAAGDPQPALAWLTAAPDAPDAPDRSPGPPPRPVGPVERLEAAIVPPAGGASGLPHRGFATGPGLLHDGEAVIRLDPATGEPAWRTVLEPAEIEVLHADAETILLWTGDRRGALGMREAAAVIALDAATGGIRWMTPPIDEILPPAIGGLRGDSRLPSNHAFSPEEVIVRLDGPRILLARRTGVIACLDRELGDLRLWTCETGLEQLHEVEPSPLGLLVSGQRRRAGRPLPQYLLVDPDSGEILTRTEVPEGFAAAWLRHDGLGTVLAGSEAGITAFDAITGVRRWVLRSPAARGTGEAWSRGSRMVVRDRVGELRSIDPISGRLGPAFGEPGEPDALAGGLKVLGHDRDLLVLDRRRLMRVAPDGTMLGADAITEILEPRSRQAAAVTDDGWIILLALIDRRDRDEFGRINRFGQVYQTYRLYVLSPDGRVQDDVVELPEMARQIVAMQVLGDRLLLGTQLETLVIPLDRSPAG